MAGTVKAVNNDVFAEINTTPLIDVMLVLLTLLIITLPLQTHAIKIDTPRPVPTTAPPPTVVSLGIDIDGAPVWNGRRIDRATLDAYLADAAKHAPQPEIHIRPDRLAKYDAVALVLADAARAGETHIGFDQSP